VFCVGKTAVAAYASVYVLPDDRYYFDRIFRSVYSVGKRLNENIRISVDYGTAGNYYDFRHNIPPVSAFLRADYLRAPILKSIP
jgi:hypothetical protein